MLTSCGERDMRAELARRGRSGGSSGPGPAAAAAGATFGEEESGRRRSSFHWVVDEACLGGAAHRSLGMAEAAAESMTVVCFRRCPRGGGDVTRLLGGLDLDEKQFDLVIHRSHSERAFVQDEPSDINCTALIATVDTSALCCCERRDAFAWGAFGIAHRVQYSGPLF